MNFFALLPTLLALLGRGSTGNPDIEALIKQLVERITALENSENEKPLPEAIDVRKAQEKLKALGFDPGPIDGKFGKLTKAATEAYQQSVGGLAVDGLIGPLTYAKLMSEATP